MRGDSPDGSLGGRLRDRQKRFTHDSILDAAVHVFVEVGYSAATIEDIANAAGTSRQTFYQYFASKADVVLTLMERKQTQIDALFGDLFAMSEPSRADLRRWILRAIDTWYPASPEHVVVQQAMSLEPAVSDSGSGKTATSIEAVADFLRRHNSALTHLTARVSACHLIAEFEMLTYLRALGIPGTTEAVVDTLVASWLAALG